MTYVIGIDLGTSAVKSLLVNRSGEVTASVSKSLSVQQPAAGHSEQNPDEWVEQTEASIQALLQETGIKAEEVESISFSGQMHGLVLLDETGRPLRPAILWNDTRTSEQCETIRHTIGENELIEATQNTVLEGFTLPKMLWVQEHEPEIWSRAASFLLPKDYVRYRLTGSMQMELSDAAGTLLLDVKGKSWSRTMREGFNLSASFCPPLIESHESAGPLTKEAADKTGLHEGVNVIAGGADNACGALGSGITEPGEGLLSIGTSGVLLVPDHGEAVPDGRLHYFNHASKDQYYYMGVTLSAGNSLQWVKDNLFFDETIEELVERASQVPAGAEQLLFTPFLTGERTPYMDAGIRGSFIGLDIRHTRGHIVRAVMEGITYSLKESHEIILQQGFQIDSLVSIGGGAKSSFWLQMQADAFGCPVRKLAHEQGPGLGAAMLAAYGTGWFTTLEECKKTFVKESETFYPDPEQSLIYEQSFQAYKKIYAQTSPLKMS